MQEVAEKNFVLRKPSESNEIITTDNLYRQSPSKFS